MPVLVGRIQPCTMSRSVSFGQSALKRGNAYRAMKTTDGDAAIEAGFQQVRGQEVGVVSRVPKLRSAEAATAGTDHRSPKESSTNHARRDAALKSREGELSSFMFKFVDGEKKSARACDAYVTAPR